MIKPELLHNPDTGELVLKMTMLGAGLCWRLPMEITARLKGEELTSYIRDLIPKMTAELLNIRRENQKKLRKKHERRRVPRKKHRTDQQRDYPRAVDGAAAPANEPTGVR